MKFKNIKKNKRMTALQWLLNEWPILESKIPQSIIEQALEMEKKQIIDAHGFVAVYDTETKEHKYISGETYFEKKYQK